MNQIIPCQGEDLLELGKRCGAVYVCPKVDGVRKGPLVVYNGKDSKGRNFVGDIYFNFRKIECEMEVLAFYADAIIRELGKQISMFDTIVGIPHGGRTLGQMIAFFAGGKRFTYADKILKPKVEGKKQEYTLDLSQFEFAKGERVAIVEDVFNNFLNTDNTITEVSATGVTVVCLIGALNRSPVFRNVYISSGTGPLKGARFPIVAAIQDPFPEYEQDDPAVAHDIAAGNLELEVKRNWGRLMAIMRAESVQIQ